MPNQTQQAVDWALQQPDVQTETGIDNQLLVDKVREYFNTKKIAYQSFSYYDVEPYL